MSSSSRSVACTPASMRFASDTSCVAGEQRDLADLLEVHPDGVEAAALGALGARRRPAVSRRCRGRARTRRRCRDGRWRDDRARARLVAARAAFVFAPDVVDDLVDDVEAACVDALEDCASSSVSGSSFGSAEKISPVVIVAARAHACPSMSSSTSSRGESAPPAIAASALLTVVSSRRACPACSFAEPP